MNIEWLEKNAKNVGQMKEQEAAFWENEKSERRKWRKRRESHQSMSLDEKKKDDNWAPYIMSYTLSTKVLLRK